MVVKITGDTAHLVGSLETASKKGQGFASKLGSSMQTLGKVGFLAAAAGAAALAVGLKSSIDKANEQIRVEAQLDAVLKSTGGAAGMSAEEIKKLAASLQKVTTYGDETIIGAQNILLTFTKIGKDVFPQATETVLNMSTALGQDLKSSSIQLGKALQDPVLGMTALRRVGVNFSEAQVEVVKQMVATNDIAGAQALILKELETEFGGSARAAADTFGGRMQQLKNIIGDIQEKIGMALIPVLQRAATALQSFLVDHQADIERFVKTLGDGLGKVGDTIGPIIDKFRDFWNMLDQKDKIAVLSALAGVIGGVLLASMIAFAVASAAAFATNPITLFALAIAGTVVAITLVVRHWDQIWAAMQAAPANLLNWLKRNWQEVVIGVIAPWALIIKHWKDIFNAMPAPVQAAMNAVAGIIEKTINWIINRLNDLIGVLNILSKLGVPGIPEIPGVNLQLQPGAGQPHQLTAGGAMAALVPVEGVRGLQLAVENFGRSAQATAVPVINLGEDLGDLGGGAGKAGGAAKEALTAFDAISDGIISLAEAQELSLSAQQAATYELAQVQAAVTEETWRAQVELNKLAIALGDRGVSAEAFAFQTMIGILSGELTNSGLALESFISDGVISLKEAIELGLNPAQTAAIELTRERFQAEQEAADAAYRGNVELIKLADLLGREGLSGAAFQAAIAVDDLKESFEATQQAFSELFQKPTVEVAELELEQARLELERMVAAQSGASEEYIAQLDAQIAAIGADLGILGKRHDIMQLEATLADQTLLTEAELARKAVELTEKIALQSGQVDALTKVTMAQTWWTGMASNNVQYFSDIMHGYAEYQSWLGRHLGDAMMREAGSHYDLASAAGQAAAVLRGIQAPAGYQSGGIVPGPIGAPQFAVVHGGEEIIPPYRQRRGQRAEAGGGMTYNNWGRQIVVLPNVRDHNEFLREQARLFRGL